MEIDNYSIEQILNERAISEQFLKGQKVVDFEKVFNIIQEKNLRDCDISLCEDWGNTAGPIIQNGITEEKRHFYGASTWATPIMIDDEGQTYEVWKYIAHDATANFEIPLWFRLAILKQYFINKNTLSKEILKTFDECISYCKYVDILLENIQQHAMTEQAYNTFKDFIQRIQNFESKIREKELNNDE